MIISASRRTDIPTFYSDWLVNRLKAGYCLAKNPYNPQQVRRVSLLPQDVDGIVLWTKNAAPLLPKIAALDGYKYCFQYSITPYHFDIEAGITDKKAVVIPTFVELAKHVGKVNMVWRYDPIVITERYNFKYHIGAFTRLCELLSGNTEKCVTSFVEPYKSVATNLRNIGYRKLELSEKQALTATLFGIAKSHGITLHTCCSSELGLPPISCVDSTLFGKCLPQDKNQREGCNCAVSVDIGAYNSCMNGCLYCYANHIDTLVKQNYTKHNPNSEMLV